MSGALSETLKTSRSIYKMNWTFLSIQIKASESFPVYKGDDETEPGNYQPISLLSIFNRIFEKLMYRQLKNFLDKNDILFKSQYGFREKHSTQHAVVDIVNIIQNNMDLKLFTYGMFLDLKKGLWYRQSVNLTEKT